MKIWFAFLEGNLYNDTTGIDVHASTSKYADLVEAAIRAEYPDADIEVSYERGVEGAGGGVHVAGEMIDDNTFSRMQEEESVALAVEAITASVYNAGEWYVLSEDDD